MRERVVPREHHGAGARCSEAAALLLLVRIAALQRDDFLPAVSIATVVCLAQELDAKRDVKLVGRELPRHHFAVAELRGHDVLGVGVHHRFGVRRSVRQRVCERRERVDRLREMNRMLVRLSLHGCEHLTCRRTGVDSPVAPFFFFSVVGAAAFGGGIGGLWCLFCGLRIRSRASTPHTSYTRVSFHNPMSCTSCVLESHERCFGRNSTLDTSKLDVMIEVVSRKCTVASRSESVSGLPLASMSVHTRASWSRQRKLASPPRSRKLRSPRFHPPFSNPTSEISKRMSRPRFQIFTVSDGSQRETPGIHVDTSTRISQ